MGTPLYFMKETIRGFLQAKLMTFVSVLTIAVTLFFLGCSIIIFLNLRLWFQTTNQKTSGVLYLEERIGNDSLQSEAIMKQIKAFPEVKSIVFVSKKAAWRRFENLYGAQMLEAISSNPFPASFEITLNDQFLGPEALEFLKVKCAMVNGIEDIAFSDAWIQFLRKVHRTFIGLAAIVIPLLVLGLHVLIANTIKLTIYARKELIVNMRFVGATDFFIKMPFILEGMLQGMIGGVCGIGTLWLLKHLLARFPLFWGTWYFMPSLFLTGIFFGWLGSVNAVHKFLKA